MASLVVTDSTFPALEREAAVAARHGMAFASHQCRDAKQVADAVRGAKAVLVQFAPLQAEAIAGLAPEATIVRYGVGYDNVDVAAALRSGHRVCYVPDYCTDEVADHTVALMLAALRRLPQLDASVRAQAWTAVAVARPMLPFDSTRVGFIGLGRIGSAVLKRIKPFGFEISISDPALGAAAAAELGVRLADTATVLASSDVLLLHAPSTARTRNMLNAEALATMRPGALIVNCARGDLIDEQALAQALFAGRVRAALDVFAAEPLTASSPLRETPNTLLTPHAAWYSERAIGRLQELAADEVDRGLRGLPPRCPVPAPAGR